MEHPKVVMIDTRVLVLPQKAAEFYDDKGMLAVPDTAKESPPQGEVVAIGGNVEVVKVGDKVLYTRNSGIRAEFSKTEYLIMRELDIHCIL